MAPGQNKSVLGLHVSSRGLGWVLFDAPASVFDWGIVEIRGSEKNTTSLRRIERLLVKYHPHALCIESFEGAGTRRRPRIRRLYRLIVRRAKAHAAEVAIVSRSDIRQALAGAASREAVAACVAERIPPLRPRLPKRRPIWVGENPSLAMFSAAACVLTYYAGRTG